ncbi:MAG: DUF4244 domain-containing protein [Desulfotignum sp.]|nr:DUF4244 domain-containing protein [Desulfotignum sp.]
MEKLMNLFKEEEGATAVEYGIMVAAIAAVIILIVIAIGDQVKSAFESVNTALEGLSS